MNTKNSILLISDDKEFLTTAEQKLIFLRNSDAVVCSDYKNAEINVELSAANIILIHENSDKRKTLEIINSLKENPGLTLMLVVNDYDKEFILQVYDAGMDDFILAVDDDFEYVIRVVNNIKYKSLKFDDFRNIKLLMQLNVIDKVTGLYNYQYASQVIENVIFDNLLDSGVFLAVSPAEECKINFSFEKLADAIKHSVRIDDVVTLAQGAKFYILLPKTEFNGALAVLNKINENYGENFKICAGISSIENRSFKEMESASLHALSDALATHAAYIFAENKPDTLDEWLENENEEPKNYKIFRQVFNKKMDKVIAPVFYRLQKKWEEKLFKTKIEQYTNEEECVFHLKNDRQDSMLRIVYPGFSKIIIYVNHEGLDSPENNEIHLALNKISQKELVEIVENFIKEFKYTSQ